MYISFSIAIKVVTVDDIQIYQSNQLNNATIGLLLRDASVTILWRLRDASVTPLWRLCDRYLGAL